uniref:DNA replication licensing factor MCM7 n=1 Tax=Aceria tosichella TaxID=561515 RepID=A0A6G1SKS1_9ACAR
MDQHRDYGQDQELFKQFLREYTHVNEDGEIVPKYSETLTKLANRELLLMVLELADLEKFNSELTRAVIGNTTRYVKIFYQALDEILPSYRTAEPAVKEVMDVFIEQRKFIAERNQRAQGQSSTQAQDSSQQRRDQSIPGIVDINGAYPPDLIRRAEIAFKPPTLEPTPIRQIKAEDLGKLVSFRGIVVRTTEVKPKITVACYTCDQCGCETFQCVKGVSFTPLFECTSAVCKANKVQGRVTMQHRGSKFVKFQEIKLQEHSDQVPTGHIPRAITVFAYGELTRRCAPGDLVSISGVFLAMENSNFKLRSGGLTADTFIEAHYIAKMNKTDDDELNVLPMSQEDATELARGTSNFLGRLSRSIAPEIYGHEDLKEALLLLLVGGVDRNPNGMKIRGNINICLMGDPGVAKSQLLGFIDRLASRCQYTTGRGSSGVGLTAAVMKDPVTGEMTLEGGALVLADEGICCIDEFDKMMDADRTAIHEVMEQQTVSIAKAGIMTTLNARVSILAAANPAYGRYNTHKTVTENLDLPPALLSRFDLLWLIKDRPETANDKRLGNFITHIHSHPDEQQAVDSEVIDMKTMRRYIELCKTKSPIIPPALDEKLVDIYLGIRALKRVDDTVETLFTSPRSLLAIIRMSTAFARLRLSDVVEEADINEAVRLYECSRKSIDEAKGGGDVTCSKIYSLLRELAEDESYPLGAFIQKALDHGFDRAAVDKSIEKLQRIETIKILDDEILLV